MEKQTTNTYVDNVISILVNKLALKELELAKRVAEIEELKEYIQKIKDNKIEKSNEE